MPAKNAVNHWRTVVCGVFLVIFFLRFRNVTGGKSAVQFRETVEQSHRLLAG